MAMVDDIKRGIPGIEIIIESTHPHKLREFSEFAGHEIVPRIFDVSGHEYKDVKWKKYRTMAIGAFDSLMFLKWAMLTRLGLNVDWLIRKSRRSQARLIKSVDAVVSVGGGFLSSLYNYHFRLYIYLLGMILGKPVIVYAQSVGPFDTGMSRWLIPKFLNRCQMVSIREPNSLEYVKRNGVTVDCKQTADAAFLLEPKPAAWIDELVLPGKTVAIGMKHYSTKSGKRPHFVAAVEQVVQYCLGRGYRVVLVNHVQFSQITAEKIAAKYDRVTSIAFGKNPRELKEFYSRCEFVVSGIMHPTIFAAERSVPFVAIRYEPKLAGLIEMLQYDQRCLLDGRRIAEPDFKDEFLRAVKYLEGNRAKLTQSLSERMPAVRELARKNIDLLKQAIF